jgi:hypothetical protein
MCGVAPHSSSNNSNTHIFKAIYPLLQKMDIIIGATYISYYSVAFLYIKASKSAVIIFMISRYNKDPNPMFRAIFNKGSVVLGMCRKRT